jgi:catechol 2,3-dioxygenase-like lactoylglutathione lyase family enzyme
MINGAHVLLYSKDPEADRAFFRDVLQLRAVDAGGGWLIFALPPAELGVHPVESDSAQPQAEHRILGAVLHFMCDDLQAVIRTLATKNVTCSPIGEESWGIRTAIPLPSGGAIGLYQPKHATAISTSPH